MDFDQILGSSGLNLGQLGARFGLDPEQTRSALGSLMPAVLGGFHKQAEAGDPGDLASAVSTTEPHTAAGNDILGKIFGNKDVSRQVADHAAGESGLPSAALKAMLPIVAAVVARHLAANGASGTGGGALGNVLASVLGGSGGGLGGMLGGGTNPLDTILAGLRR